MYTKVNELHERVKFEKTNRPLLLVAQRCASLSTMQR